jgi:hypothetical protein
MKQSALAQGTPAARQRCREPFHHSATLRQGQRCSQTRTLRSAAGALFSVLSTPLALKPLGSSQRRSLDAKLFFEKCGLTLSLGDLAAKPI